MIIKELSVDDAKQLVQLMKDVEASSPYMLMEAGERTLTVEGAEAIINRDHITVIGAVDGERLIGYTLVIKETVRRKKHCASIVVGVHKDYRGWELEDNYYRRYWHGPIMKLSSGLN